MSTPGRAPEARNASRLTERVPGSRGALARRPTLNGRVPYAVRRRNAVSSHYSGRCGMPPNGRWHLITAPLPVQGHPPPGGASAPDALPRLVVATTVWLDHSLPVRRGRTHHTDIRVQCRVFTTATAALAMACAASRVG